MCAIMTKRPYQRDLTLQNTHHEGIIVVGVEGRRGRPNFKANRWAVSRTVVKDGSVTKTGRFCLFLKDNRKPSFGGANPNQDVLVAPDSPRIEVFKQAWEEADYDSGLILPNIWYLYRMKDVPVQYEPQNAQETNLYRAAKYYFVDTPAGKRPLRLGVVPAAEAAPYHDVKNPISRGILDVRITPPMGYLGEEYFENYEVALGWTTPRALIDRGLWMPSLLPKY